MRELSKFAPKVYEVVQSMLKSRAVVAFEVVIPSQKIPSNRKQMIGLAGLKPPVVRSDSETCALPPGARIIKKNKR